ncbi:ATP-binding protein [Paenibacillus allorhizosphaerae]|uniref:histidine kinase n=1 Tax=Paenibacillus allorhizosphaerae TaxID=2849866 RepID=A0ABN7TML2_9BACL|nr:ATP-binding protein [Paenibacillus allorhizosphaerae]CAG7647406.1 Sensor histidine kinase RcsC [Paenibacillus allorhizosphaerae]
MSKPVVTMLCMIGAFFVILLFFMYQWLHPTVSYPAAHNGMLDARGWNFAKQGIIPLQGEWEFYEGKLLKPEDFENHPELASERRMLKVPGSWKGVLATDGKDGYGAGTYRLLVQVDKTDMYALRAKKIRMSSHVYMNGTDLGGNGTTALDKREFVASNLPFLGVEKADAGTVEIVIQVASLNFLAGGLVQAPEFGMYSEVLERVDNSRLADMVQISTMLLFALYYGGMFRQWRKERHLMYFSLFCLATGVFFSLDNEILMTNVFPNISFVLLQKTVFVSVYLSFLWFASYIFRYLGQPDNFVFTWTRRVMYVYFIFIILPNDNLANTLVLNLSLQAATFANIFYVLIRGRMKGVPGTGYLSLGVFFLITSWGFAQFRYELALDNPYYMIISPLLLVFSQAFLMSNRIQQEFHKNEKLSEQLLAYDRQKDEFLAKTSHELRTPLHGLINLSQSMLEDRNTELPQRHKENVRLMNLVGRRLAGLVHDILDMSLMKHGQLRIHKTAVDLRMTVGFVLEMLSITPTNKLVMIVNDVPGDLPLVYADENRLKQILYNLLENGLKFTESGTVRITAEHKGTDVVVSVIDTGRGIPEEQMGRIFRPFEQYVETGAHSPSGIGLGLSITKQLVELQDGTLEVTSEVGQGTCFTFNLPVAERKAFVGKKNYVPPTAEPTAMTGLSSLGGQDEMKILIVDDEPFNVKILIDVISSLHYGYTAVHGGKEAIEAMRDFPKPDLVLLDLMMPGVSGLDVCREIRKTHGLAELPVLMLTASGQTGDTIAAFAAGANDILQKPFELAELKARVQSLLSMKRSSEHAVRREMDFLQAQITPHFLYNSLNALVGLSYKNTDKLRETIHHLTTYLRGKFTFTFQSQLVSFDREMELVEAYLAIEQLRFGSRLQVRYEIEPDFHCMMPPLTLQPLVENAVRHGIGPKPSGGTVLIRARRVAGGGEFTVEDDGIGMGEEVLAKLNSDQGSGVGTLNVNRRLKMLYAQKLEIDSEPGRGTTIKFFIAEEPDAQSRVNR